MSDKNTSNAGSGRPGLHLTRRSLVAAAGILAAVGPGAAKRAFASGKGGGHGGFGGRGGPGGGGHGPGGPGGFGGHGGHGHGHGHGHHGGGGGYKCMLARTHVLTPNGEVSVEDLKIGDLVVTKCGSTRDIRWISKTVFERDGRAPWAEDVRPIRIAKDAICPGCPHRDLYLSRAHMLYLNGVLIPVCDLINGRTIVAVNPDAARLEYFHVELDRHDVLIVEGAPCESLLVTAAQRGVFSNADEYSARNGSLPVADMVPYAPIASNDGGRGALKSRLRSALAPVVDLRGPADIARDDVEARAWRSKAA